VGVPRRRALVVVPRIAADLPSVGVVFFFPRVEPYVRESIEVHKRLGIPLETLDRAALARRFPQMRWEGVEIGLFEPDRGALMARRAVQTLVQEFVAAGGEYRQTAISPPRAGGALEHLTTSGGEALAAEQFVFACGPWLPKVFPEELGGRIFVTRQEVFFFAPPAGDTSFAPGRLPGWADFNEGDIYYGFPDLEARGVRSGTTATVHRSIPTSAIASRRPARSPTFAPSWNDAFQRSLGGRWSRRVYASTKTVRTAIC
jgi:glycine/D-amino acid oxidase-like deaminating enzyme